MNLIDVSTADLRKLRDMVASRAVGCPLTDASLRAAGFGVIADVLRNSLPFADRDALVTAVDLVVEERVRAERPPLELVWTGPASAAPQTRDTAVVLADLFTCAKQRVMVAGYAFTNGSKILAPLHEAMRRGVEARFFLDIPGQAPSEEAIPSFAAARVADFVRENWRFGAPYPEFFYDPRTARPGPEILLHAKCAVVDGRRALVTSANFTFSGQMRHIEVGVLIDDVRFAGRLEGHFNVLVAQHLLSRADWSAPA